MSRVIETSAFPSAMEDKLRRIRWRQIGLAVVRAIALSASVLIAAMLAAMLADWWFTLFSTTVRTGLTLSSLALATAVLLMAGVRPVIDALGWARAANDADAEVPQLEERWTTVSHVAKSNHQPGTELSNAMLKQVTSEAVALERLVEPARVVRVARLNRVLIAAGASVAVFVGFLAANWEQNSVLLRRFWAPTSPITATQLTSVTGDAAVPRGKSIDIVTQLTGMHRDAATLALVVESGETDEWNLPADADAPETFTHYVDVDESFRYQVRAGDGRTEWHSITAIDPPEIDEVRLTVVAPEYVDREPYEKTLLPGRVKAIQGSRLTLEMRSDSDLASFQLLLTSHDESGDSVESTLDLVAEPGGWYRFETTLEQDLALSPALESSYGLTNDDRRVCRIRVIPDKAPVARVISPTDEMSVGADEVIDIKFEAHDDHGIAKAELVVYQEDENGEQHILSVEEIPLGEQQLEKHILAETQLDLSDYQLDEGASLSYAVRVTDNRMLNLDPEEVAANKGVRSSADDSSDEASENDTDASVAESGKSPKTQDTADADPAAAGAGSDDEESPDASQIAKRESSDQGDPSAESAASTPAADSDMASTDADATDPAEPSESVAESGSETLQVGKEKDESIAATGAKGNTDKKTDDPAKPAAVVDTKSSAESEAPADSEVPADSEAVARDGASTTTETPDAPTESVAASADGNEKGDTPQESSDSSESSAVSATASNPSEQSESPSESSSGGSSEPQPESGPQLAQGGGAPQEQGDSSPQAPGDQPMDDEQKQSNADPNRPNGSIQVSESSRGSSQMPLPPNGLDRSLQMEGQRGQDTESNRLRLKITDRLAVATEASESLRSETMNTRELLEKIDTELAAAETTLLELNEQPDHDELPEQAQQADSRLEAVELIVADLRNESSETKYEFVGLQMLDIARTHVTPARDRMFVLIQDPGANPARNVLEGLHHTTTAREMLAALTRRFEEVARETELAEQLEEIAKIYEVYVDNARGVLREVQRNQNPMRRKMAVLEVDEAYLDRLTQVLEMERELMAEFARILADDPRLMGKYMDLVKRRRNNMRNRLTDLRERQEDVAYELSGWRNVEEPQRPDVWIQVAEMRLLAAKELVKNASQLEARTLSQLPLNLEPDAGLGEQVVQRSKEVALKVRQSSLTAKTLMSSALEDEQAKRDLVNLADELMTELARLDAVLEQLSFEREDDEEVTDFTTRRLAESRTVAEQANVWAEVATHVRHDRFHGLVAVDQQKIGFETDRLRVDMAGIEDELVNQFRPDDVPNEVTNIVRELLMVMETITFNQAAATFELNNEELASAEAQQTMAVEGLARAEELFDKMRRTVVDILDEREVNDPNIADLEDPTLDEFLERLEREPNLQLLIGIPNRPDNLRIIRDWMLWESQGGSGGGGAQQAAANATDRATMMMAQRKKDDEQKRRQAAQDEPLTEEEMQQFARAEDMEDEMQKMLQAIQDKMKDPATDDELRKELQEKAEMLAQMLKEVQAGTLNKEKWEALAKADEMQAMMEALAKGELVPDSQWNRLISTLDTGLWQVRGRTPPEDYRKQIEQYQDLIQRYVNEESLDAN